MGSDRRTKKQLLEEIERLEARLRESDSSPASRPTGSESTTETPGLFQTLADSAPVGIFIIQGTKFVYANQRLLDSTGHTFEQLQKMDYWEIMHPDYQELVRTRGADRQSGAETPEGYETKYVTAKGESRWAYFRGTLISYRDKPAILGVVHDVTERHEALKRLKESEARQRLEQQQLQALVDRSPLGISVRDHTGRLLMANDIWKKIWGMTEESFRDDMNRKRPRLQLNERDDYLGRWRSEVKRVYEKGGTLSIPEIRLGAHPSGLPRWVSQHFYAIKDDSGNVDRVVILTEDVTERILSRQKLAASEDRYRTLVESSDDAIFTVDYNGVFHYMNPIAARFLGGRAEELTGKNMFELFSEEDAERQVKAIRHCITSGESGRFERFTKVGGQNYIFYTSLLPFQIPDGETRVMGISRDVSELVGTRDALRASEEQYRRLLQNLPVGVFQATPGGKVTAGNEALARMYGCDSVEEYLALPAYASFRHPEQRDELVRLAQSEGIVRDFVAQMRRKDGSFFWVSASAHAVFDDDGTLTHFDGIEIDITESKLAEESLRRSGEAMNALLNAPTEVLFLIDRDGTVLAVNDATCARVGLSREELIGGCIHDHAEPKFAEEIRQHENEVFETGEPTKYFIQMKGMDLEVRLYPVFDTAGRVEAVAVYSQDITDRREAQRALEESERIFRTLAEASPVGIVIYGEDKFLFVNQELTRMLGLEQVPSGEVDFFQFLHPDDRQRILRIAEARRRGESVPDQYDCRFVHTDGSVHHALIRSRRIDYRGASANLAIIIDITERREAEEALRAYQSNLSAILENTQDYILLADKDAKPVYFNSAYAQIMKDILDLDMKSGVQPHTLLPDANQREFWEDNHRRALAGERFSFEHSAVDLKQRTYYLETAYYPITEAGEVTGFCEYTHDITDRKEKERALKESEAKFRRITERSFDIIFIADLEGNLNYVSPAVRRVLDLDPEEMIGHNLSEFVTEGSLAQIAAGFAETARGHRAEELQFEAIHSRGGTIYVEANCTPVMRDGRVIGNQMVVRDITRRRVAQQMLEQAHDEQSKQLRQVAGGLAHDVYNDLFPVTASLHNLRKRIAVCDKPEAQRNLKLVDLMETAVSRAITLTESVNLYSRLDRLTTDTEENLADVVAGLVEQNSDRLAQLGVKLKSSIPEGLAVRCPQPQIHYLLNNLLLNSLDALKNEPHPRIEIEAQRRSDEVEIRFWDNGSGIEPEVLPRIFEPFFSTKPRTGTGLGLAIVQRIVDLSAGWVRAESSLDKGTTFIIVLPGDVGT